MEVFVFLLYVFGFVVALMPFFIYRELRRQGVRRSDDAGRILDVLDKIDGSLREIESCPLPSVRRSRARS